MAAYTYLTNMLLNNTSGKTKMNTQFAKNTTKNNRKGPAHHPVLGTGLLLNVTEKQSSGSKGKIGVLQGFP